MTSLTASGWLFLGWTVFALGCAVVRTAQWDTDSTGKAEDPGHSWFVALLSLAWVGWLVSP